MLNNIEACIFDLDGTLVDSMWLWRSIDIEYLGRFGIQLPDDLQSAIEGMSFSETAVYIKERFNIPDDLETMKNDWNKMALYKYENEVPLKDGAYDFLCYCKENHIKLGIATSNSRVLVDTVLKAHKIEDFFECIVTGCDVKKGKPAPDVYLSVASKLKVNPDKCLVFEDIIAGINAGLNAGMRVCAVEDKYSEQYKEEKIKLADYYINNYMQVINKG